MGTRFELPRLVAGLAFHLQCHRPPIMLAGRRVTRRFQIRKPVVEKCHGQCQYLFVMVYLS